MLKQLEGLKQKMLTSGYEELGAWLCVCVLKRGGVARLTAGVGYPSSCVPPL